MIVQQLLKRGQLDVSVVVGHQVEDEGERSLL